MSRAFENTRPVGTGKAFRAIVLLFGMVVTLTAATVVCSFEGFPDSTVLTNQYPGITFANTIVLTAGITLNEFEFPPHSGSNVASDNGGPITITFAAPVQGFGGYFTYSQALTMQAFNAANQQLAVATSKFSNNEAISGVSGSSPNEFMQVASTQGISSVTITGNPAGGSLVMDDATMSSTGGVCNLIGNGTFSVSDVQFVINEALGVGPADNDLNGDGVVNVIDVQIEINAALNLGCSTTNGMQTAIVPRYARPPLWANHQASPAATTLLSSGASKSEAVVGLAYNVTDLGTLGGNSALAYAISNVGQVVGASETGERSGPNRVSHAFLWEAGRMTDLGVPGDGDAVDSAAFSINDTGEIAGAYWYSGHDGGSFLRAGGITTAFSGRASAINNVGQGVGEMSRAGSISPAAFLWTSGRVTDLGTLGGNGTDARAINDVGQVVGFALVGNSAVHAFLYSGTVLTDLGTLGGANSVAFGINSTGQIVGASQMAGNGPQHAFLYSGGRMTDLGTLGGTESQALGINSRGLIVGWSGTASGEQHAFLWSSGRMLDLNGIAPIGPGAALVEATAINDLGQIVANGSNGRAYLITLPLSE